MNRFDRIVAILVQLQAKRQVLGTALAAQFSVSLRTVYRDLRTLEAAGVPLTSEAGVGYSLAEGYRLPPVMFTREEATALLTAEKLVARLTDAHTAALSQAAMDKLRAVLRRPDRDYLERLSPHIQILRSRVPEAPPPGNTDLQQRLLGAIAGGHLAHLHYQAGSGTATERDVEPIGLYLGQHWHLVAYCRLRHEFRDFRHDRITQLQVLDEVFVPRPETLQHYWQQQAARHPYELAVVHLAPDAAHRVQDTKRQHGWVHEDASAAGVTMTLRVGCLRQLAAWLLPLAGQVAVVSPPELGAQLRELAEAAYHHFCVSV